MKKFVLFLSASLLVNSNVYADNFYGKLELGTICGSKYKSRKNKLFIELNETESKKNIAYGLEVGYKISSLWQVGLNLNHISMSFHNKDIHLKQGSTSDSSFKNRSTAILLNNYYIIPLNNKVIRPYLMAGLGVAFNKPIYAYNESSLITHNISVLSNQAGKINKSFAWNLGLGTQIALSEGTRLDLGAKYFNYGLSKTNSYISKTYLGQQKIMPFTPAATKIRGYQFTIGLVFDF